MLTLATFRLLGKHLVGALSGIYMAAFLARAISRLWPSARLTAFVIAALFFVLCELCVALRELRRGPQSTGSIILDFMPLLLLGGGISLFLGGLANKWFGSDWGGIVVFYGVYFCILMVVGVVKYTVQDRNLKEDLKHPRESDPEEDRKLSRKYMNPYM